MRRHTLLNTATTCAICALACLGLTVAPALAQETPESLARQFVAQDRHGEAIVLLESVPADSLTPAARYLLGTARQALLRHEQGLAALRRADTTAVETLVALGRSLDALGRQREAAGYLARAYAQDSTNQRLAINLAELYTSLREYPKAEDLYLALWPGDSTNAVLNARLGSLYRAMDSTAHAIGYLERSRRANPHNLGVVLQLTAVYMSIDLFVSARRVVDAALQLYPEEGALWIRSGDVAMQEQSYPRAVESYGQALTLGDTTAAALRNYGIGLYMTERLEDASDPLALASILDPRDHVAPFYYGLVLRRLDLVPQAIDAFEMASERMDRSVMAELYIQLAGSYAQMGRRGDAATAYQAAFGLDPKRTEVHYYLAFVLEAEGNPEAALRHYRTFLASEDDDDRFADIRSTARQRVAALSPGDSTLIQTEPSVLPVEQDSAGDAPDSLILPADTTSGDR